MTITLNALQKQRRDTASNWTSNNPTLLAGEFGWETDTKKIKLGDGSTAWQSLDYLPIPDTNRLLTGNLTVGGNFTVNGTTTTIDTTTLTVEDKNIEIGKVSSPSDTTADGGGLTLKGGTDKTFNWVNSTDSWTSSEHLDFASGKVLKIAGTQILSATQYTGNSATTTALATARTIGGVSFDGTGNINLPGVNTSGNQNTSGSSGSCTGNAATATALQTARTISGVSFDGTQNITLNNNAITNGAGYLTNLVSDSSPQLGGTLDLNGNQINGGDSNGSSTNIIMLGASDDLKLYHDGSNSNIKSDTNALIIRSDALRINNNGNTETMIKADADGAVELYHGMSGSAAEKKLETTSWGAKVTGNFVSVGHAKPYTSNSYDLGDDASRWRDVYVANDIDIKDNGKLLLGDSDDLEIYHNGTHSILDNTNGNLQAKVPASSYFQVLNRGTGDNILQAQAGGSIQLFNNGTAKLETTTDGITVTGAVTDSKGNLRSIPKNSQSNAYTLVASDAGKFIEASNGVTIPSSVFSAGDAITILNQTGSNITLTSGSGLTLYNAADAATGNRTLSSRGLATVLFASGTTAHISGAGLS